MILTTIMWAVIALDIIAALWAISGFASESPRRSKCDRRGHDYSYGDDGSDMGNCHTCRRCGHQVYPGGGW